MVIEEPKPGIILIKGDSVVVTDELIKELGEGFADAIITDPPYGCRLPGQKQFNSEIPAFDGEQMFDMTWKCAKSNAPVLMFSEADCMARLVSVGLQDFKYFYAVNSLKSRGHLNCGRRPMLRNILVAVFYKHPPIYNPQLDSELSGTHIPTDMLTIVPTGKKEIYPHERNVKLLEFFVKTYTNEGDVVFDFCMGAGSLAEACFNTNRKFIGIELIEDTYNKALKRISEL